jgi:hypothetical protein
MLQANTEAAQTVNHTTSGGVLQATLDATEKRQSIASTAAAQLGVEPNKVCELLRNVWKTSRGSDPLSDHELFQGMSLIARFELDPITREIYVTRDGKGRLLTIVGIDGWIKILDRTPHYDGFDQELEFSEDGKTLIAVETTIFSKERSRPAKYKAYANEYARVSGMVAKSMPWHMLRLFSLRHAARLFTPLGGNVVTEEEAEFIKKQDQRSEAAPTTQADKLVDRLKGMKKEPEPEQTKQFDDGGPQPEDMEPAPVTSGTDQDTDWEREGGF